MNKPHLRYRDQTPRERTWTIHFIAVMKFVKAAALIAIGIKLLTLFNTDVHEWANDFVTRHGIDAANKFVENALHKLEGVGNTQIVAFSTVAFCYSGLLLTEGVGLWMQKRWAEWLTAVATALFIPLELYEIYERFTFVRIGILVLNVFIVWYLVTRLRDEKKEERPVRNGAMPQMHPVRVKICGITNADDAILAVEKGADEIGFNFYDKSKRYITPEKAEEIVKKLNHRPTIVGVFVNERIEKVIETANHVGLNGIQLHGDEDQTYILELKKKTRAFVIKAFRLSESTASPDAMDSSADFVLFDSYSLSERGGTGITLDWNEVGLDISLYFPGQAYLAGGLTPENVDEAIKKSDLLYAVDVASGVESSPGKKDSKKVEAFIQAVRAASVG